MTEYHGGRDATDRRFCLVTSRFNQVVTERLLSGARETLERHGAAPDDVDVVWVPGAWELPWAVARAAGSGYDAVVALGCVVRGETPHFDYICHGTTRGLMRIAENGGVPVTFGVITCEDMDQALARAGGEAGNKGAEAAAAALELCGLAARFPKGGE